MPSRLATRLAVLAVVPACAVAFVTTDARADGYLNKHVRITLRDPGAKPVTGKVINEDDEEYTLKLAYGVRRVRKDDVEKVEDIGSLIAEYEKRLKEGKTGDELYQLGQWAKAKGLESKLSWDALRRAIEVEPNHEKSRHELGYEGAPDGRGGINWVNKREAKERKKVGDSIGEAERQLGHRNWDDEKVVSRYPANKPEYEIISNCPKEVVDRYAKFMADLKLSLADLISKTVKQPIQWQKVSCTACNGSGGGCNRCGGSGREPSKVYILNSQKLFMELTGKPEGVGGFYVPFFYPPADCERPIVCFHGTFGLSGNTYSVLGHEGTHQLEHLMWKGNFSTRPPWMIEGLAVYFGDGLDLGALDKGKFVVEIPRDRLSGLKRMLKTGHNAPIKMFTLCQYNAYQQNPILYNHAWSLIYYMLHSNQDFEFKGKKVHLNEAFARFFMKNTDEGFWHLSAFLGAQSQQDIEEVLAKLETGWKSYVLGLPIKSVFTTKQDKGKPEKYVADELCFELQQLKRRKGQTEWALVPDEELGWGEALKLQAGDGYGRLTVGVEQNSRVLDVDKAVEEVLRGLKNRYVSHTVVSKNPTTHNGLAAVELELKVKEREHPMLPKPRAEQQWIRMIVFATPKRIYTVTCAADESKVDSVKPDLEELVKNFRITGG